MGAVFAVAAPTTKLTRGQKYVEAKMAKIDRELTEEGQFATMDIQDQPIRDMGVTSLAGFLEKDDCKIDKVILRKNNATATGMTKLAESLGKNKSVTELTVIDNKIGDQLPKTANNMMESTIAGGAALVYGADAAEKLADNLKLNSTLMMLRLEDTLLGNEGCSAIAKSLVGNTTLTRLALQKNDIGNEGVKVLAQILGENHSLLRLDLQENVISDEGGIALCAALQKNTGLSELNLRANLLTPLVCTELAAMLNANRSLLELNLRRNALRDEGCSILAKALEHNNTMKKLFLSSNLIGCEGCVSLAESLEKNKGLEEIHLEINNIADKGCTRFAEALEKNDGLVKVDLQMNSFTGPSYRRLEEALEKNASLRHLLLSSSLMDSKEAVKNIDSVLHARLSDAEKEAAARSSSPLDGPAAAPAADEAKTHESPTKLLESGAELRV